MLTTKSVVQDKDGKDIVVEHVSKEEEKIWEIKYQEHSEREKKYKEDKIKVYALLPVESVQQDHADKGQGLRSLSSQSMDPTRSYGMLMLLLQSTLI